MMAERDYPKATEPSLFQNAEMTLGAADALLKRVRDLETRLRPRPKELDTAKPERAHNSPAAIIQDALSYMREAEGIVEGLVSYVGQPGEGSRG